MVMVLYIQSSVHSSIFDHQRAPVAQPWLSKFKQLLQSFLSVLHCSRCALMPLTMRSVRKKQHINNKISFYLIQRFIKIDRGIICLWSPPKWTLNAFEMIIGSTSVQTSGWVCKCVCFRWGSKGLVCMVG